MHSRRWNRGHDRGVRDDHIRRAEQACLCVDDASQRAGPSGMEETSRHLADVCCRIDLWPWPNLANRVAANGLARRELAEPLGALCERDLVLLVREEAVLDRERRGRI